jgi:hypothetical protein
MRPGLSKTRTYENGGGIKGGAPRVAAQGPRELFLKSQKFDCIHEPLRSTVPTVWDGVQNPFV